MKSILEVRPPSWLGFLLVVCFPLWAFIPMLGCGNVHYEQCLKTDDCPKAMRCQEGLCKPRSKQVLREFNAEKHTESAAERTGSQETIFTEPKSNKENVFDEDAGERGYPPEINHPDLPTKDSFGECPPGANRSCQRQGQGTQGDCKYGIQFCASNGSWSPCYRTISPKKEVCNGKDDNCDGKTDEDFPEKSQGCFVEKQKGPCQKGSFMCQSGKLVCKQLQTSKAEVCNGIDDDCDGTVDEGCSCQSGDTRSCGNSIGACLPGKQRCVQGKWESGCKVAAGPKVEACNGKDDDCDGQTDESFAEKDKACKVSGKSGPCANGKYQCRSGALYCLQFVLGRSEVCNGIDDDCDGSVDETFPQKQTPCKISNVKGPCANSTLQCEKGKVLCLQTTKPTPERWNNIDDDCDGQVDEGLCLPTKFDKNVPSEDPNRHKKYVAGVTLSSDGKWAVSIGVDGTKIWDPQKGTYLKDLPHMGESVSFSADDKLLVTSSGDKTIVWETGSWKKKYQWTGGSADVTFVGKTKTLLSVHNGTPRGFRLFDASTGKLLRQFSASSYITSMAVSPDGMLVLATDSRNIWLWELKTGKTLWSLRYTWTSFYRRGAAFNTDGSLFATRAGSGIEIRDTKTRKLLYSQKPPYSITNSDMRTLLFHPDNKTILARVGLEIVRWDYKSNKNVNFYYGRSSHQGLNAFAMDKAGKTIISAGNREIIVWDSASLKPKWFLSGKTPDRGIRGFWVTPDKKTMIVADYYTVRAYDVGSGKFLRAYFPEHGKAVIPLQNYGAKQSHSMLSLSSDGRYLAVVGIRALYVWEVSTAKLVYSRYTTSFQNVLAVQFMPKTNHLVLGLANHSIQFWNIKTGKQERLFQGHLGGVSALALNKTGTRLLSGSEDNTIKLWDLQTSKVIRTFVGNTETIMRVHFSPDEKQFASVSLQSIRIWSTQSRFAIHSFAMKNVGDVAFHPDGRYLVAVAFNTALSYWDIQKGSLLSVGVPGGNNGFTGRTVRFLDGKTMLSPDPSSTRIRYFRCSSP